MRIRLSDDSSLMSTPFAFDIVENSMNLMVDGDDIRVAFSKDLYIQKEPLSLSQAVAWLHPFIPHVLATMAIMKPFMRQSTKSL